MRARTQFTSSWVTDLHLLLDAKYENLRKHAHTTTGSADYPLQWAEILRGVVMPIVNKMVGEKRLPYFSVNGPNAFGQLVKSGSNPLGSLSKKIEDSFKFADTELLMYHNSGLPGEVRSLSIDKLLAQDTLIMELIRMSFTKCRKSLRPQKPETDGDADTMGMPNLKPLTTYVVPNLNSSLRHDKGLMRWIKEYVKSEF